MKILFLYTKLDKALKIKIAKLLEAGDEVSTLSLLEYKLQAEGNTTFISPPSKLEFLENSSAKLRVLNRIFKRKKMLLSLQSYDIIDLYKCEKSALFIVDEIRQKSTSYIVTISDENEEISRLQKPFYTHLYEHAHFLIFRTSAQKPTLFARYQQKSRLIYEGISMLREIDNLSEEALFKASFAMGFDLDKDIIYCDLSAPIEAQLELIDTLLTLPISRLEQSTFIFHLNAHNLEERASFKQHLEGKNFDYLLIETLITPKQNALLYKLADKALIMTIEDNPALALSLYAKNLCYLYKHRPKDSWLSHHDIFIETFSQFKEEYSDDNPFIQDLLEHNKKQIHHIFDIDESIKEYKKVIEQL